MAPADFPAKGRILVRLPNFLGDVLFCTPSLAALRRRRPGLSLTALVKPGVKAVVEAMPFFEEVRVLRGTGPSQTLAEARALRREAFDGALVFPKGFREALLPALARIPVRAGLATDRRSPFLTHPVPFGRAEWHLHHVEQFARVLGPLGVCLEGEGLFFPVSGEDRRKAEELLGAHGVARPYVVLHPGASKPARAWREERFAAVAEGLRLRRGVSVVLTGTEGEGELCRRIASAVPGATDLSGRTPVGVLAALIEGAALFLGNDSGPMHIAAAVGTPVAAVFGPGAPHKTRPWLPPEKHRCLWAALPCSPCRQAFWKECRPSPAGKPPCLEALSAEAVLRACLDLLGGA